MSALPIQPDDASVDAALSELRARIAKHYPSATFEVGHGADPPGTYLVPIIDVDDTEELFDLIGERLLEMQIEERLRVYVFPIRPLARVLADLSQTGSSSSSV